MVTGKDRVIPLLEEFNLMEGAANLDNGHVSVAPVENGITLRGGFTL